MKAQKRGGKTLQFLQKPSCTTCRKAKALVEQCGWEMESRDLGKDPLSAAEIEKLIGDRDYLPFLNPRNELYRAKKMKLKPPSRSEAVRMMAKEPNLIRRPVIVHGDRILLWFDEDAIRGL
jgi:arsenate reductase